MTWKASSAVEGFKRGGLWQTVIIEIALRHVSDGQQSPQGHLHNTEIHQADYQWLSKTPCHRQSLLVMHTDSGQDF